MYHENPTNRARNRHVDVKVQYLRDLTLVRNDHVKLVKCAGTQNVSDDLTKSLTQQDTHDQESNVPFAPLVKYTRFGCVWD